MNLDKEELLSSDMSELLDDDMSEFEDSAESLLIAYDIDLYQDVVLAIKSDGNQVYILPKDGKLSYQQKRVLDNIVVVVEPSIFLNLFLKLEFWFSILVLNMENKFKEWFPNEDDQEK
jgi:hypothetical protein